MDSCLFARLDALAASAPDAPALLSPGRQTCSRAALRDFVHELATSLASRGVTPGDRVALLSAGGPGAVTILLASMRSACAVPLHAELTRPELAAALTRVSPRLLVAHAPVSAVWRQAAADAGLEVVVIHDERDGPAGAVRLATGEPIGVALPPPPESDREVLWLHTSATSGPPGLVPYPSRSLDHLASSFTATLGLDPGDRALCAMPLHHAHGIVISLLAPLASGGAVAIAEPGEDGLISALEELQPTWVSAGPALHRRIANMAGRRGLRLRELGLRFLRSSSSPLPGPLQLELEELWGAPVREGYGLTEAPDVACNGDRPETHRRGSVGRPTGCQVSIRGLDGEPLLAGAAGEVLIRGPGLFSGYVQESRPPATASPDGWFPTGDQGRIDTDGFLWIRGRIKELVDCGGEKIAPVEVEDVFREHPDVSEALCVALPDPDLGEVVGVAVVPKPGARPMSEELLEWARPRLARFRHPRVLRVLEALPQGPTGKPLRRQVAALLERPASLGALPSPGADDSGGPPRGELESRLAVSFAARLGVARVGRREDFFALGGDSLSAISLIAELREQLGVDLPITTLFRAGSVADLAELVERQSATAGGLEQT